MGTISRIKEFFRGLLAKRDDGSVPLDEVFTSDIGKILVDSLAAYLWKPILRLIMVNCRKDESVMELFRELTRDVIRKEFAALFAESGTVPIKVEVMDTVDGDNGDEQIEPILLGMPDEYSDTTEGEGSENGKEEEVIVEAENGETVEETQVPLESSESQPTAPVEEEKVEEVEPTSDQHSKELDDEIDKI